MHGTRIPDGSALFRMAAQGGTRPSALHHPTATPPRRAGQRSGPGAVRPDKFDPQRPHAQPVVQLQPALVQVHRQLVEPLVTGGGLGQMAGQLRAKTGLQRSVLRHCHRVELRQGSLVVGNAHPNGNSRRCGGGQKHTAKENRNKQAAKQLHRHTPMRCLPHPPPDRAQPIDLSRLQRSGVQFLARFRQMRRLGAIHEATS